MGPAGVASLTMTVGFPTAVHLVADLEVVEAEWLRLTDAEEIEAVIMGQRGGCAETSPVVGRPPIHVSPLTKGIAPLLPVADCRAQADRGVEISEKGGRLLRATRTVVERNHAGAADGPMKPAMLAAVPWPK